MAKLVYGPCTGIPQGRREAIIACRGWAALSAAPPPLHRGGPGTSEQRDSNTRAYVCVLPSPCSRRPSALPGSVQTEQADPTGAAAHCPSNTLNKAHNHSSPRPPLDSLCIDNFPDTAHNPKKQGMPGKHKSNSVPSGPKSGDCRPAKSALQVLILATVGARVSSAAAVTEDGLGTSSGEAPRHSASRQGTHTSD